MLGATLGPYLERGEWQVGAAYRTFRADEQYRGTRLSPDVTRLNTQVISRLNLLDLSGTYAADGQFNTTISVPVILYGSSSRALPASTAGSPRFVQSSGGLGDISVTARRWLLDSGTNPDRNLSLGFGVKLPTGKSNARDRFPNGRGLDPRLRPVDPSIQLGDGGLGMVFDLQAFHRFGSAVVFVSGSYLANPKGETNTPSPPAFLNPAGPAAVARFQRFNTVPDQYIGRAGVTHPVPGVRGLAVLLAGRVEGVPEQDLFGPEIGFRRPGYVISVEPGLIYSKGATTFTVSFPVATQVNVQRSFGLDRDSTFADYVVLAGVTHRFGRSTRRSPTAPPPGACALCSETHS